MLLLLCIGLPSIAQQQQQRPAPVQKRDQKKKEVVVDTIPFYNGTYVGVDLYGIGSKMLGGDFMSSEVSIGVNLKNKFIPTIEFGMGGTDTWNETGIHYKSKAAPFFRIGVDHNTMAKKKEKNSYLYVGLRYAFSSFKYDVSTMPVDDPIWGGSIGNPSLEDDYWGGSIPFSHLGMKGSMQWFELVVGVKVRIYKNFNMGWSVRMKYKTNASTNEYANPWYVPGYEKVKLENGKVIKQDPRTMLSCSAVAKGYSVDVVAHLLDRKGIKNYMVDIGGEVVVKGKNATGDLWRIGINKPYDDSLAVKQDIQTILNLTDVGMATSGNYRNYYYKDGKKYAHTIDPRTGYPVQHSILSSTVVAEDCMTADALATSFMVMGLEEAEKFCKANPMIDAYFIYSGENGEFKTYYTDGMKRYFK